MSNLTTFDMMRLVLFWASAFAVVCTVAATGTSGTSSSLRNKLSAERHSSSHRRGTADCFDRVPDRVNPVTIGFEKLGPPGCGDDCSGFGIASLTHSRGLGLAYNKETVNHLIFNNYPEWQVIECNAPQFSGKPEAKACGNSSRALYAGKGYAVMLFGGDTHLGDKQILNYDLKSFYVTTFGTDQGVRRNASTRVHVSGYTYNDTYVRFNEYSTGLEGERRKITVGPEMLGLNNVFIEVAYFDPVNGFDDPQNYAIDDVEIVENIFDKSICLAYQLPNRITSSCKPSPTATKTWTVKFDETPLTSGSPIPNPTNHAELIWNEEYPIWDKVTLRQQQKPPYFPVPLSDPSAPNFLYGNGTVEVISNTDYEHFGLEEFYILQSWGFAPNDYCIITIVGRRDPYDGSGLPEKVKLEVRITNSPKYPWFSRIKIADHPEVVGGFNRLRALSIFAEYVDPSTNKRVKAPFVLDNMVFNREIGEGRACRAVPEQGWETVDFEKGVDSGQKVPPVYEGFNFNPDGYSISYINSYQPGTNGYLAVTSGMNSAQANLSSPFNRFCFDKYGGSWDSDYLFDFDSVTITIDVPANDTETLDNIRIGVFTYDACGYATQTVPEFNDKPFSERTGWGYYARFFPPTLVKTTGDSKLDGKRQQYTLRYPWKAISYVELDVRILPSFEQVPFWVDQFTYRMNRDNRLPACALCRDVAPDGSNDLLGRMCEVPAIPR
ncbi:hypothetical protein BJ508DRAFT_417539 [Ascobolus immersus RN42]|uniref:Uncharacterized protein n=1 Tax=Ascobolus immersus RN42 TaxID=1160509 RepID=A0A3N4HS15_ASCIM|nr:hypothetical protein BJ508DRAFT_417539 [Ascobolus immersus RN42]